MCRVNDLQTFSDVFAQITISLKDMQLASLEQKSFADKLRYIRKERGLTQLQFAELINRGYRTVIKWELNDRKPTFETIVEISSILDIDYNYLLDQD